MIELSQLKKLSVIAVMVVTSFLGSGCFEGGGSLTNLPESELANVNLQIRLGRVDADAPPSGEVLNRIMAELPEESIQLRDMILRFSSNLNDTVWDTVLAGAGTGFGGNQNSEGNVTVNVALQPLRWWNIQIVTHDVYDSIIHFATVGPIPSKGGQSVNLDVPLINSRFSLYEARYTLPSVIYPANVPDSERVYQKIFFSRLVLSIDSTDVRDSSSLAPPISSAGTRFISAGTALKNSTGSFFFKPSVAPDTITHVQVYKYVRTGPRNFNFKAYGYLEGDSVRNASGSVRPARLLFEGNSSFSITPGATLPTVPIVLDWKGPGSKATTSDTVKAGDPDWSGLKMTVSIGKVESISQTIEINPGIP